MNGFVGRLGTVTFFNGACASRRSEIVDLKSKRLSFRDLGLSESEKSLFDFKSWQNFLASIEEKERMYLVILGDLVQDGSWSGQ